MGFLKRNWEKITSDTISDKTYNSLKMIDDETLISELVHRGYEITSTSRETPNKPANVVKIG